METTIAQRVTEFMRYTGENQVSFSQKTGIPQSSIATMISRNAGLNSNAIERIHIAFPIISLDWLITGSGPMLKSEQITSIQQRLEYFLELEKIALSDFCKIIELPKSQFHNLNGNLSEFRLKKIIESYPQLSIEWLMTGEGKMIKSLSTTQIKKQNQYETIEANPLIAREPQTYYKSNKMVESSTNEYQVEKEDDHEMTQLLIRAVKTYQKREDELVTKIEQLQAEIEQLKLQIK